MNNFQYPMRATVVTTVHPQNLMMARIRVNGLHDNISETNLPWAERNLPDGGAFSPLIAGDTVWVDFPYAGDSRRPRIVGFAQDASGGSANVAAEASGVGDGYQQKDVEGAPAAPSLSPTKDYVYKRNNLMEVRSAGGGWSLTSMGTGTTMGINEGGEQYILAQADVFIYSSAKVTVKAAASMLVDVTGDLDLKASGDINVGAGGTVKISGSQVQVVKG